MSRISTDNCNSRPQFLTSNYDCAKCSGETGMFVMSVDEDCDFSFDLCFECADVASSKVITNRSHQLTGTEVAARREMNVDRKLAINPPMLIPTTPCVEKSSFESDNDVLEMYAHKINATVLRCNHHYNDSQAPRDLRRRHHSKRDLRINDNICQPCHQLLAVVKDCNKCATVSGISLVCVEEDCEFSFDLCFGCGEAATSKGCKSSAQPRNKQLRDKANLPSSQSFSL